jgi:hypothetical protein
MSEPLGYNTSKSGTDCTWSTATDLWSEAFYTWLDACFKEGGGGIISKMNAIKRGSKEQQRRFCKLVCEIKGEEYEETKYFRPNVRITVSDVKLVEKELKKVNLNIFIEKRN